jgi:sugar lactone lactonase YvrE
LIYPNGRIIKSFGAGLPAWPHGIHVDAEGNVWIAGASGDVERAKGNQIHKFSSEGGLLMSLSVPGIARKEYNLFDPPNDVLVATNGDILVADGHSSNENNRILKLYSAGEFLM